MKPKNKNLLNNSFEYYFTHKKWTMPATLALMFVLYQALQEQPFLHDLEYGGVVTTDYSVLLPQNNNTTRNTTQVLRWEQIYLPPHKLDRCVANLGNPSGDVIITNAVLRRVQKAQDLQLLLTRAQAGQIITDIKPGDTLTVGLSFKDSGIAASDYVLFLCTGLQQGGDIKKSAIHIEAKSRVLGNLPPATPTTVSSRFNNEVINRKYSLINAN